MKREMVKTTNELKGLGDDFGLDACLKVVKLEVEVFKTNVFEAYGRSLIRAKQDICFNTMMLKAYEKYIKDNNFKWNDKV